jgi:hypothetical protein
MPPADLRERLRRNHFEPFRIVMSDGTSYTVRSPEFLMVGLGSAVVGVPADEDASLYRVAHQISLRHIVRLEPLDQLASPMTGPAA